jgi:hypothetical protein
LIDLTTFDVPTTIIGFTRLSFWVRLTDSCGMIGLTAIPSFQSLKGTLLKVEGLEAELQFQKEKPKGI